MAAPGAGFERVDDAAAGVAVPPPMLALAGVEVRRGGVAVVRDVDLAVRGGEVVALLGPSGAGKSSLLLAVAGLVEVARGTVRVDGRDVTRVPAHRRRVGMVFQEYALFPHMDVAANVAYGLHGDERDAAARRAVVDGWLDRVGLPPATFRHRDVATLSGGQRQRVALARSLAPSPPVLLLDEPLGALDRQLREELLGELARVVRAADGPATVVVTHDRDEAFTLGDRVGVLRDGRLVQLDTPATLWARPVDEWTARFLGHPNVLSAQAAGRLGLDPGTAVLLPSAAVRAADDGRRAVVRSVAWRDGGQRASVDLDGVPVVVELAPGRPPVEPGDELAVEVDPDAARPLG